VLGCGISSGGTPNGMGRGETVAAARKLVRPPPPAAGETEGTLLDDDIRCLVHVADLAAVLLELSAMAPYDEFGGVLHAAGSDALSRYELGCLLAERGGLDVGALPKASKASVGVKGTTVRLDSAKANGLLAAKLRGAREFAASSVS
jgi:dTDP-4-dehydrorhamnose reductase